LLHQQLTDRGLAVLATKEPSGSRLGYLVRQSTDNYSGLVLARLVAADRYHHLEHEIRPALRAGHIVLCDRYMPTSLVLQRIDGVEPSFLWQLNQYADVPALTVILTGDSTQSRTRARQRGTYSRFHRDGGDTEVTLYRAVVNELAATGWPVMHHEIADEPAEIVADLILDAILGLLTEYSG
jgi:dTMP kinase